MKECWRESKEPLGTVSYRTRFKQLCECWLLIGQKKYCFILPSRWAAGPQSILCVHLQCVQCVRFTILWASNYFHTKTSKGLFDWKHVVLLTKQVERQLRWNFSLFPNTTQLEDVILMIQLFFFFSFGCHDHCSFILGIRLKQNLQKKQDKYDKQSIFCIGLVLEHTKFTVNLLHANKQNYYTL